MILADKILALRKNSGWSQEELAEKISVSRQSVSKWESAAAIPDINKILELANLFGVTTDYLLKDDIEQTAYSNTDDSGSHVRVSLQAASDFLKLSAENGRRIAFGVMLCILSPIVLILLAGMSDAGKGVSSGTAAGIGIVVLLIMVAVAASIFIICDSKMKRFDYLQKSELELEYGVSGIVKQKSAAFENTHTRSIAVGVALCILSAVPLIIAGISDAPQLTYIFAIVLLLAVISVAVRLLVTASTIKESYDLLLGEGEFEPENREINKKTEKFAGIYWPVVVAVYLGWSFISNDWHITWIVWPIAALLFGGISAVFSGKK